MGKDPQSLQQLKVNVAPDLYEAIKIQAVKERRPLRALVTEAIEKYLRDRRGEEA